MPDPRLSAEIYESIADIAIPLDPQMVEALSSHIEVAGSAAKTQLIRDALLAAGAEVPKDLTATARIAVAWANEYAARLVAEIQDSTRAGIAEVIADGLERQKGVPGTARMLRPVLSADDVTERVRTFAGLNKQRVQSVLKYEKELIKAGYSPKQVAKKVAREARHQLKARSELIAQQEMHNATSAAQAHEAATLGFKEKRWQTVGDERVRESHRANEQAGWIPTEQPFPSGGQTSPDGVGCRCVVSFRGVDTDSVLAAMQSGAI